MKLRKQNPLSVFSKLLIFSLACLCVACDVAVKEQTKSANKNQKEFHHVVMSNNGHFQLILETESGEMPPIGEMHKLIITLLDKHGKSVPSVIFSISGGMPSHGHGLPTQPRVTEYLGEDRYLVEGVKFNMTGEWVFNIGAATESTQDSIEIAFQVLH